MKMDHDSQICCNQAEVGDVPMCHPTHCLGWSEPRSG